MKNDSPQAQPPERIWLQWHGDADPEIESGPVSVADVTWEREQIFKHDVEYVRADLPRAAADDEWLSIETAPINERILVTYPSADGDEEIHIATLADYLIPGSTHQWLSASWAVVGSGVHVLPTRWRRLPSLTGAVELTVEAAAKEIRELWPNCSFQIREENNAGFYKPFQRHFEIGVISTDFDVHGERFEGATLDEAMQKCRAWAKSRAGREGESK